MRWVREFAVFPEHDIYTLEYENGFEARIAAIIAVICSFINYIYFTQFYSVDAINTLINSAVLLLIGLILLYIGKLVKDPKKMRIALNVLFMLGISYFVVMYYPLIGPTVWTYSFIVIIITLVREDRSITFLISLVLAGLGGYIWLKHIAFTIDSKYYLSQFIAFAILFTVLGFVFENNKKRNIKIRTQILDLEKSANDLLEINTSLEKEIAEHQNTILLLNASEDQFKSIVQNLPDVIFKIDSQGLFVDCYSEKISWLLVPKSEFIGKHLGDILPPTITEACLEKIELVLSTGQIQAFEYSLSNAEGMNHYEVRFIKMNEESVYVILRDTTESKRKQEHIEYLSTHDQLTGLHNRHHFENELEWLDRNENLPITIAMLDVNGLKLTNDAFGHVTGDMLLKKIANILLKECRQEDSVSRIGGDEFAILLPRTSKDGANAVIRRIAQAMASEILAGISISVSIGFDTKAEPKQSIHSILSKAEEFMYKNKLAESKSVRNHTIQVILKTLNEKCSREKQHSERVREISIQIGELLGLSHDSLKELETAALMHDIGKISIGEQILNKAGKLTASEYAEMKRHAESGYQILKSVDTYSTIAEYVLCHHERWDGTGYPRGMIGEDIPLIARIISVADAFDAMTAERTYRRPCSKEDAFAEIEQCAGTQFDPNVVVYMKHLVI